MKYVAPESGLKSFTCPHCGVLARHYHYYSNHKEIQGFSTRIWFNEGVPFHLLCSIRYSLCENCKEIYLWYYDKMVYPSHGNAPIPNPDMPEDVKEDYEEAATICTQSPRGAAALLRLAIQKLCVDLGGKGKNINEDIKEFVKKGLPEKVQKSLDIVRVVGNNAVHPGQIEIDKPEVAGKLFELVNLITDYMISMPKKVDATYSELPDAAKNAIDQRDK